MSDPALQAHVALLAATALSLSALPFRRNLPGAAMLIAAGVVARVGVGGALFWVSYLHAPLLPELQAGDGFWNIAIDARTYFELAAKLAALGSYSDPSAPSPAFITPLVVCIRIFGPTPAAGIFLNAAAYAGSAVLMAAAIRHSPIGATRQFGLMGLFAYTFSPSLILFSAQVLKDGLFAALVVVACVAMVHFTAVDPLVARDKRLGLIEALGWFAALLFLVYWMSGIRPYYPVFLIGGVLAGGAYQLRGYSGRAMMLHGARVALAVALLWGAARAGSQDYYRAYEEQLILKPLAALTGRGGGFAAPLDALEAARRSFAATGGATNVAGTDLSRGVRTGSRPGYLMDGLGLVFVPVSLLRALSFVTFRGGRGFLWTTDVDTVFLNLTFGWLVWFAMSRRTKLTWCGPYLVFIAGVCLLCVLPMAYVVTNYGTLFRLRIMFAASAWMVVLAVRPPRVPAPSAKAASLQEQRDVALHSPGAGSLVPHEPGRR